jgi:hypothetical protein
MGAPWMSQRTRSGYHESEEETEMGLGERGDCMPTWCSARGVRTRLELLYCCEKWWKDEEEERKLWEVKWWRDAFPRVVFSELLSYVWSALGGKV